MLFVGFGFRSIKHSTNLSSDQREFSLFSEKRNMNIGSYARVGKSIARKSENTSSQVTFRGTKNSSIDHPDDDLRSGYETSVTTIANSPPGIKLTRHDPVLLSSLIEQQRKKQKKTNKTTKNCSTYWTRAIKFSLQFMITVQEQPPLLRFSKSHFESFLPLIAFI